MRKVNPFYDCVIRRATLPDTGVESLGFMMIGCGVCLLFDGIQWFQSSWLELVVLNLACPEPVEGA
jgi:hypothetical protein